MLNDIQSIKSTAREEISRTGSLKEIHDLKVKYLGKKGILTSKIKSLGTLSKEERREQGQLLNGCKNFIQDVLNKKEETLKEEPKEETQMESQSKPEGEQSK